MAATDADLTQTIRSTSAGPGGKARSSKLDPRPDLDSFSSRAKAELARLVMRDRDQRMRRARRPR
jgi:hypothetical protein